MKKLILLTTFLMAALMAYGEEIVSGSYVSNETNETTHPLKLVREINGGTIFKVRYDNSINLAMRGAFEHACKLLEEYLPSNFPITIKVGIGEFDSESQISKVSAVAYEQVFGYGKGEMDMPLTHYRTKMKYVLYHDYAYYQSNQFWSSVPNMDFFLDEENPDINIIYNQKFLSSFSYSLTEEPGPDYYDFVSIALRDILKGLGFNNNTKQHPSFSNQLIVPSREFTDFEDRIMGHLRSDNATPSKYHEALTTGYISLMRGLKLYAPQNWINGESLNYFIPDTIHAISNVLSYDFGRGTFCRNINDKYSKSIFEELLGWYITIYTGTSSSFGEDGSNSNLITFKQPQKKIANRQKKTTQIRDRELLTFEDSLYDYLSKYVPIGSHINYILEVLKKDGTWDEVAQSNYENYDMSTFTFHYEDNEYARTCDGHLRARSIIAKDYWGRTSTHATYYVLDYLPQQVEMKEDKTIDPQKEINQQNLGPLVTFRRFSIKNLEGLTDFRVEVKKINDRLPVIKEVSGWKNGSFSLNLEVGNQYTVTAVGYNKNGSSRSIPLLINTGLRPNPGIVIGDITLESNQYEQYHGFEYEIIPINSNTTTPIRKGNVDTRIPTSDLPKGMYVLNILSESGIIYTQKFVK